MNFEVLPELKWRYGYDMVLAGDSTLKDPICDTKIPHCSNLE